MQIKNPWQVEKPNSQGLQWLTNCKMFNQSFLSNLTNQLRSSRHGDFKPCRKTVDANAGPDDKTSSGGGQFLGLTQGKALG